MATINKNGTPGTAGTSGGSPTAGTNGGSATFTQNGMIGADSTTVNAIGGVGGAGGNGVGVGIGGANGGDGGLAFITFNGNIFNAPASTNVLLSLNATGGNGGAGGTGTPPGTQGKGGNATITANGNIFQPNKVLTSIELDAFATGGTGSTPGNASSTVNGNIFQTSKAVGTVTVKANAAGTGTNNATLNGNIIQGNISNVTMTADAANGTATINGNIIQPQATNTGTVLVEASGSHIAITQNKFNMGLQEFDLTINPNSPYDTTITGNTISGQGTNTFVFTDIAHPGPNPDTITINLASSTMVFDGQASNAFSGFTTLTVAGTDITANLTGSNGNDTLTGSGGNDTFTGGKGNDAINGGAGTDTAIYTGNHTDYTIAVNPSGNGTVTDNVAGRDGTDTLTSIEKIQFADGVFNTGTGLFTGVNHAPVLTGPTAGPLNSEPVNAPAPVGAVGTLVSSLVSDPGNVTDADGAAPLGIALTGTDNANGTWYYSINGGTTWNTVGAVSDTTALLLDSTARLYFKPNVGFSGTDANAITFRAWDESTGTNGTIANASVNGGTTAFSTTSDNASITITSVNHAPVLGAAGTLNAELEDAGTPVGAVGTPVSSLVSDPGNVTDADGAAPLGIALTGTDTTNGSWFYSTNGGTTWAAVGAVTNTSALLLDSSARLYFKPNANYNGTDVGAITYRAWDESTGTNGGTADTSTNGGSTAFSTASDSANITITPVNDAPVLTGPTAGPLNSEAQNAGAPVGAVGTLVSSLVSDPGNVSDVDGAAPLGIALTSTDTANGTWYYSLNGGTTWNTVGAVTNTSALLLDSSARLYFQPNAGYSGTDATAITFRAWDESTGTNGGTANTSINGGTTAFSSTADTAAITITPNSAPVLDNTKTPVLATEGENAGLPSGMVGTLISSLVDLNPPAGGLDNVTDSDAAPQTGIALTGTDTTHGSWFYSTDNGTTWNAVGPVSNASALLLAADANTRIYFQPTTNYSGTDSPAITFRAWDRTSGSNGATANTTVNGGSTAFSAATDTADITVAPVRIGNTYFNSINAAMAAAVNGDTIFVSPGTYNENVVVNKSVTIVGTGPGVVIHGTFSSDNGIAAPTVGTPDPVNHFLQSAPGYSGAAGTGILVSASNVTLSNITVEDYLDAIGTSGAISNLTLNGVTMQHSVNGFAKHDGSSVTGLNVNGGDINDTYIGAYLYNDDPLQKLTSDATNTTFTGTTFENITQKGIYAETAQGNTLINGVDMTNVGQYGGGPAFGANGLNGNGIDFNLKFNTYVGNMTIENFDLQNTGSSGGQNGAIVVEGRDDPGHPIYGPNPADVSGLNVNIQDGTINGTTTGIRTGELNKADPAHNVTGPPVTISNVDITNASVAQIDNHTQSLMTVEGTGGDDTYVSAQTPVSTGPIFFQGFGGNDTFTGGTGDDTLQGGAGDDTLDGGSAFSFFGDTADYSDGTQNGLVVNLLDGSSSGGGLGNDTLFNIQNITGSSFNDTLIGDGNDNRLSGGDGNDILFGHGGHNLLSGGNGTNTAYYSGLETDYTPGASIFGVDGGPEGVVSDTLSLIQRLKFLAPSHVMDTTNDGTGDLVFQNVSTGQIQVNNTILTNTIPVTSTVVGTGMFNPDDVHGLNTARDADILVQASDGTLSVLYDINGVNSSVALFPAAGVNNPQLNVANYNNNWKAISTGDFNGDASSDVLLQNTATKAVEIFTVKANSTDAIGYVNSVTNVAAPAGTGWNPIASGDFNGDGKSDILWQNSMSKAVEIYLTNDSTGGTLTTLNTPTPKSASGLTAIGTGDFNGDGNSDILFKNAGGQAVVWFMYGDTHTGTKTIANPGGTYQVSGAEDVNGNGYSDIIWKDNSGNLTASEFSGPSSLVSATSTNVVLGPTVPANFSLIASTGGG